MLKALLCLTCEFARALTAMSAELWAPVSTKCSFQPLVFAQAYLLACLTGKLHPQDLNPKFCPKGEPNQWLGRLLREENRSHVTNQQYRRISETLQGLNARHISSYRVAGEEGSSDDFRLSLVMKWLWGSKHTVGFSTMLSAA